MTKKVTTGLFIDGVFYERDIFDVAYKTSDGIFFYDEENANTHEKMLLIAEIKNLFKQEQKCSIATLAFAQLASDLVNTDLGLKLKAILEKI